MSAILIPPLVFQGVGPGGLALPMGKLFSFIAGTSTQQATYIDSTQTTQNTNPVILNANGQASVWLDPTKTYKFILQDAFGNQFGSTDNVQGALTAAALSNMIATGKATVGPPLSGSALIAIAAPNWAAITSNGSLQIIGAPISHANQNVNLTQILLHGGNAEFVSIQGAAAFDQKVWSFVADPSGSYLFRKENDALSATFTMLSFVCTGSLSGDQVATNFFNGHGSVTFATTSSNGYQATINAGAVPGFANGLNIIAGSVSADNAILIQNQGQTTILMKMTGQGETSFAATLSGLIPVSAKGIASSASPVATFGGAANNFITVTDGAGIVGIVQATTSTAQVLLGASSNHGIALLTNNVQRLAISASGAITFNSVATTTSAPAAGGAGALPATPKGYATFTIGSTPQQIAYY
jgi:hypothetical protein